MPLTIVYRFGAVVLVPFPFTDQSAAKQRPAVVISSAAYHHERPDLIVMAVTSQLRPSPTVGEVFLQDWQAAGLIMPSAVKPSSPRSNAVSCASNSAHSPHPIRSG